jgi:vitamin B12 transporter
MVIGRKNGFLWMVCGVLALSDAHADQISLPAYTDRADFSDTIQGVHLGEVTVIRQNQTSENISATPLQVLNAQDLSVTGALQVSDAVKFFSGVTVKDYGGLGGMKSVSVRSMGAQHTAVSYDGIVLSDCQTGQIDIGRYSLENVEEVALQIGDGNIIFQPARMFGSSGLLLIRTHRPIFTEQKKKHIQLGYQSGSFGLVAPFVQTEWKLNRLFDLSCSGEYLQSNGQYPYRLYYADGADDYTAETRINNQLKTYHLEATLWGHFQNKGALEVKGYYYDASRGLPGAVILYNPGSSQHLWDKNAFLQAHYEQNAGKKFRFQLNGKYNWSRQRYLNPDYLGSSGQEDYSYTQEEGYFSSVLLYQMRPELSFAWGTDVAVNEMQSNMYNFVEPERYSLLSHLSAKYVKKRLLATAVLLTTSVREKVETGTAGDDLFRFSPALNLSVQPLPEVKELRLRMFCKSAFRLPSFNDLYYSAIGSTSLKPENSLQTNLGLTYEPLWFKNGPFLRVIADVYYNRVTDKIMAIPTKNIFIWSMVNLGKVDIRGVDLSLEASQRLNRELSLLVVWNHSYQRALDVTDPASKVYRQQIAYAPRIFGSGRVQLSVFDFRLGYAILYSGHRFVTGQNLAENNLPGYTDQSFSLECPWQTAWGKIIIRGEVLNVGDKNYEVVRNFPMPGRNYRCSLRYEF